MKKLIFTVLCAGVALFVGACTDDKAVTTAAQGAALPVDGSWADSNSLPGYTVSIDILIPDSSFSISMIEGGVKTLYTQIGTWRSVGDSVRLKGVSGTILDTTTGALSPLPHPTDTATVYLDTWRTAADLWPVSMADLATIINALPLSDGKKSIAMFVQLQLKRTAR